MSSKGTFVCHYCDQTRGKAHRVRHQRICKERLLKKLNGIPLRKSVQQRKIECIVCRELVAVSAIRKHSGNPCIRKMVAKILEDDCINCRQELITTVVVLKRLHDILNDFEHRTIRIYQSDDEKAAENIDWNEPTDTERTDTAKSEPTDTE